MRLAGEKRLRRAPLVGDEADRLLSDLAPDQRLEQAWLLAPGGQRWAGPEAIWHALYLSPLVGRLLRPLRYLPGFQPISRWVYHWVATHRRSLGCRLDRR